MEEEYYDEEEENLTPEEAGFMKGYRQFNDDYEKDKTKEEE